MVISGKGSNYDIVNALALIKQQWEETHEISKNKKSCPESSSPAVRQSSSELRENLPGMVSETD